jgi:hypothetical protein
MRKTINLTLMLLIFTKVWATDIESNTSILAAECIWHCEFEYPQKHDFTKGEGVYVKVKAQKYQDIAYINLYVNSKFIRKESQYPYEWCQPNNNGDSYLRNLSPGSYKLRAQVVDKCGKKHDFYYDIKVTGNNQNCHYSNPVNDLQWLKQIRQQHSDWSICEYKKSGKPYFKVYKCSDNHYTEYWYDCFGEKVCQFQKGGSCNVSSGAQMIKCWYDPCGNNNDHHCEWDFWFDTPKSNHSYNSNSDVYVKVDAKHHQDIEWMELYVNNSLVRKETSYPYEWCRHNTNNDHKLRKLKKGSYHLRVKVKDKCGDYHEKDCHFTVT